MNSYKVDIIGTSFHEFVTFTTKYFLWIFVYITPIHDFLITILILLAFDLITGLTKAVKTNRRITTSRLRDSVIKMVFYSIAVFISYQVDKTLLSSSSLILTKIVGGYIMLIEFQSNIENISEITGVNIWMALKDKILNYFEIKTKDNDQPKT